MQIERTKSNAEYEFNSRTEINMSQEKVEKKLLNRFNFLQQEGGLLQLFSSYDFRPDERNMVDTWEKIIDYLLSDVFNCFGITMSNLKKYSIVKNRIPVGLNNIIHQLRIEQKYITEEDLKNDKFYQINFPDLYPQTKGYISGFFSGIQSFINIAGGKIGCKEENDNNEQQMPLRTDITEEDKYKNIPENSLIFNFEKFRTHSNHVLSVLTDILHENDVEVIPTSNFINTIKEKYTKKNDEIGGRMTLSYGVQYIDYVLYYLMKIKKIALFEIESNPKNIECIKLLKDINDTISEKDKAIAKILSHIELLEKRINDFTKKDEDLLTQVKMKLKKGDKQGAKLILIKRKQYQKHLENLQNSQSVLEQQIFDLRNAESNVSVTEILKQTLSVGKEIGLNPDEFAEVTSDLKEQKDALNEINDGMKEFANEKDDEELNKEMEQLMLDDKKAPAKIDNNKVNLPDAHTEEIDENKIFEDLLK